MLKKFGIPITTTEGLREIDGGSRHGNKYIDIMQEYPEEYHIWKTNIGGASLSQGESVEEFSKRVVAEVMHISELHPNQTIMIVAHAVVIRAVMAVFMMRDISKAAEISWVPNASVTVANYENALLNFETVGFDGYLKEHKSNLPSKLV